MNNGFGVENGNRLDNLMLSNSSFLHGKILCHMPYKEWRQAVFALFQFCGELGHTFMEFVTNSGDYCQAQHV